MTSDNATTYLGAIVAILTALISSGRLPQWAEAGLGVMMGCSLAAWGYLTNKRG